MSEILKRFSLEAAKFNGQVLFCLAVLWLAVVTCALFSIRSQNFSPSRRRIWTWVVIGVPFFGLLAYLPFAIRREDLPPILVMLLQKDRFPKAAEGKPVSKGGRSA